MPRSDKARLIDLVKFKGAVEVCRRSRRPNLALCVNNASYVRDSVRSVTSILIRETVAGFL